MGAMLGHRGLMMMGASTSVAYRSRLQFGGADGSTTFTDDTGKAWTAFGNAQIDTSLGDQRALFDGNGDYITTPSHADLNFGAGDFKIAFTLRFNNKTGYQTIISKGYAPTIYNNNIILQTGDGDGLLNLYINNGTSSGLAVAESGVVSNGVDYAMEIERIGTAVTIKRDGVTTGSGTSSASFSNSAVFAIGGGGGGGFNQYWFNGWLKDFSVT